MKNVTKKKQLIFSRCQREGRPLVGFVIIAGHAVERHIDIIEQYTAAALQHKQLGGGFTAFLQILFVANLESDSQQLPKRKDSQYHMYTQPWVEI